MYVVFVGVSGSHYYRYFDNVREAEIFKQCFQLIMDAGIGTYKDVRIRKKKPTSNCTYEYSDSFVNEVYTSFMSRVEAKGFI